jgi:hypothetical protein
MSTRSAGLVGDPNASMTPCHLLSGHTRINGTRIVPRMSAHLECRFSEEDDERLHQTSKAQPSTRIRLRTFGVEEEVTRAVKPLLSEITTDWPFTLRWIA